MKNLTHSQRKAAKEADSARTNSEYILNAVISGNVIPHEQSIECGSDQENPADELDEHVLEVICDEKDLMKLYRDFFKEAQKTQDKDLKEIAHLDDKNFEAVIKYLKDYEHLKCVKLRRHAPLADKFEAILDRRLSHSNIAFYEPYVHTHKNGKKYIKFKTLWCTDHVACKPITQPFQTYLLSLVSDTATIAEVKRLEAALQTYMEEHTVRESHIQEALDELLTEIDAESNTESRIHPKITDLEPYSPHNHATYFNYIKEQFPTLPEQFIKALHQVQIQKARIKTLQWNIQCPKTLLEFLEGTGLKLNPKKHKIEFKNNKYHYSPVRDGIAFTLYMPGQKRRNRVGVQITIRQLEELQTKSTKLKTQTNIVRAAHGTELYRTLKDTTLPSILCSTNGHGSKNEFKNGKARPNGLMSYDIDCVKDGETIVQKATAEALVQNNPHIVLAFPSVSNNGYAPFVQVTTLPNCTNAQNALFEQFDHSLKSTELPKDTLIALCKNHTTLCTGYKTQKNLTIFAKENGILPNLPEDKYILDSGRKDNTGIRYIVACNPEDFYVNENVIPLYSDFIPNEVTQNAEPSTESSSAPCAVPYTPFGRNYGELLLQILPPKAGKRSRFINKSYATLIKDEFKQYVLNLPQKSSPVMLPLGLLKSQNAKLQNFLTLLYTLPENVKIGFRNMYIWVQKNAPHLKGKSDEERNQYALEMNMRMPHPLSEAEVRKISIARKLYKIDNELYVPKSLINLDVQKRLDQDTALNTLFSKFALVRLPDNDNTANNTGNVARLSTLALTIAVLYHEHQLRCAHGKEIVLTKKYIRNLLDSIGKRFRSVREVWDAFEENNWKHQIPLHNLTKHEKEAATVNKTRKVAYLTHEELFQQAKGIPKEFIEMIIDVAEIKDGGQYRCFENYMLISLDAINSNYTDNITEVDKVRKYLEKNYPMTNEQMEQASIQLSLEKGAGLLMDSVESTNSKTKSRKLRKSRKKTQEKDLFSNIPQEYENVLKNAKINKDTLAYKLFVEICDQTQCDSASFYLLVARVHTILNNLQSQSYRSKKYTALLTAQWERYWKLHAPPVQIAV